MRRSKSRAMIHTSGASKGEVRAKARGAREAGSTRKTRQPQAIIDTNRKTEICRNWLKGCCTFEGRCAFAHGAKELKYRTLREMEDAGRIPDANKYRCYPCMTWVATGSCPFGKRCVFIHDPRIEGPERDWPHASWHGTGVTAFFPTGNTPFFFPDIARDIDSTEVPTHLERYDIDARMDSIAGASQWTAHTLWSSFVSMFEDHPVISVEPDIATERTRGTKTHGRGVKTNAGISPAPLTHLARGTNSRPQRAVVVTGASSRTWASSREPPSFIPCLPSYVTVAAAAKSGESGFDSSRGVLPLSLASNQKCRLYLEDGFESSPIRTTVKHLPVFESLSRGDPKRPSGSIASASSSANNMLAPTGDSFPVGATPSAPTSQATPPTSSSAFSFWASSPLQLAGDEQLSPLPADNSDRDSNNNDDDVSYVSESSSTSGSSYFSAYGHPSSSARGVHDCSGEGPGGESPVLLATGGSGLESPAVMVDGRFRPTVSSTAHEDRRTCDGSEQRMAFSFIDAHMGGHHDSGYNRNNNDNNNHPGGDSRTQRENRVEAVPEPHLQPKYSGIISQPCPSSSTSLPFRPPTGILGGNCGGFSYFDRGDVYSTTGSSRSNSTKSTSTEMSGAPSGGLGVIAIAAGGAHHQQHQRQSAGVTNVSERPAAIGRPGFSTKDGSDDGNSATFSSPRSANPADGLVYHSRCNPASYHRRYQEPQLVLNAGLQEGDANGCHYDGAGFLGGSFDTALYWMASTFHMPPF